jgi:polyphosphate kinase
VRSGIIERIEHEVERAKNGRPALVQIKTNALVDEELVDALYRASQAGVRIDLVVRGICTLRPDVPRLSENIRVRSILGRFLEHSRVFRFGADPDESEWWIGSADLMHRNLDRRVEALVRVTDRAAREQLNRVISLCMSEETSAFELGADGEWRRRVADADGGPLQNPQEVLIRRIVGRGD